MSIYSKLGQFLSAVERHAANARTEFESKAEEQEVKRSYVILVHVDDGLPIERAAQEISSIAPHYVVTANETLIKWCKDNGIPTIPVNTPTPQRIDKAVFIERNFSKAGMDIRQRLNHKIPRSLILV